MRRLLLAHRHLCALLLLAREHPRRNALALLLRQLRCVDAELMLQLRRARHCRFELQLAIVVAARARRAGELKPLQELLSLRSVALLLPKQSCVLRTQCLFDRRRLRRRRSRGRASVRCGRRWEHLRTARRSSGRRGRRRRGELPLQRCVARALFAECGARCGEIALLLRENGNVLRGESLGAHLLRVERSVDGVELLLQFLLLVLLVLLLRGASVVPCGHFAYSC